MSYSALDPSALDPSALEGAAEHSFDVIGNIEALLRDADDYEDTHSSATNQHFFVVSTPNTPLNTKLGSLHSTMNTSALPFQPRGPSGPAVVPINTIGGDGLFSVGPVFTPYAPVHLNVTTPPRTSTLRDAVRPGFIGLDALKTYTERHYAVIVNNLDPRTQSKHLMSIFFPLGAVDALAFQSPVGNEDMGLQFAGRKGGIVLFTSSEMAVMAASKIDDFVPHGQTLPLHTTYFGRYDDYINSKETFTMTRSSAVSLVTVNSNENDRQLAGHTPVVVSSSPTSPSLTSVFLQAAAISEAECDKALDALISRFVKDPISRASIVISVCTALQRECGTLPYADHFLKGVSRFVIQKGLMDHTTTRDVKLGSGVICGAMFALQIVRGDLYGMALRIMKEVVIVGCEDKTSLTDGQISTIDALLAMGKSCFDMTGPKEKSDAQRDFEALLNNLIAGGRYRATGSHSTGAPSMVETPDALPSNLSTNTTFCEEEEAPTFENGSRIEMSCFQVTATPVKPPHSAAHNVSLESNSSSVGPRYAVSTMQTPEKRTVTMMDTSLLSNASHTSSTVLGTSATGIAGAFAPLISTSVPMAVPVPSMMGIDSLGVPFGIGGASRGLSGTDTSNLRQHLMASTVYMTKVPLALPHSTLRKLFECFGEFNKVRIYEEKKPGVPVPVVGAQVGRPPASPPSFNSRGNFGFVEFFAPSSSKAMVDFFRNPNITVQTRMGISKSEMDAILTMRVSYARSCIHDHDSDDAIFECSEVSPGENDSSSHRVKPCTFGIHV